MITIKYHYQQLLKNIKKMYILYMYMSCGLSCCNKQDKFDVDHKAKHTVITAVARFSEWGSELIVEGSGDHLRTQWVQRGKAPGSSEAGKVNISRIVAIYSTENQKYKKENKYETSFNDSSLDSRFLHTCFLNTCKTLNKPMKNECFYLYHTSVFFLWLTKTFSLLLKSNFSMRGSFSC